MVTRHMFAYVGVVPINASPTCPLNPRYANPCPLKNLHVSLGLGPWSRHQQSGPWRGQTEDQVRLPRLWCAKKMVVKFDILRSVVELGISSDSNRGLVVHVEDCWMVSVNP